MVQPEYRHHVTPRSVAFETMHAVTLQEERQPQSSKYTSRCFFVVPIILIRCTTWILPREKKEEQEEMKCPHTATAHQYTRTKARNTAMQKSLGEVTHRYKLIYMMICLFH